MSSRSLAGAAAAIALLAAAPALADPPHWSHGKRHREYARYYDHDHDDRVVIVKKKHRHIVERPVIIERVVERPVYVERHVVVERPRYVERPVYVEQPRVAYPPPPAPVYGGGGHVYGVPTSVVGTVGGALAGAAIGSTIGKGDGRTAAIAIGTVLGSAVGGHIAR